MDVIALNHAEVERLLPMTECIEVMEGALAALARGEVHNPLRTVIRPPDAKGLMGLMPAYRAGEEAVYGLKAVCVFPTNADRGIDLHQGAVLLFSAETGELQAVMNGSAITAIRTAAVSAVATRLLAREDARELALVGAGNQAKVHLEALAEVRKFQRVRVASRRPKRAREFADSMRAHFPFAIEPVSRAEEAVREADVITTVTTSREPVIKREWVSDGSHINAVGSSIPTTRELDTATMAEAALFVDRRESTVNESGDYLFAAKDGAIDPDHIRGEIGELLIGIKNGRSSPEEITVFDSLGLAVEDLAAAQHAYRRAIETGTGTRIPF
jgi:ornithine cyclodeaminase